MTSSGIQRKLPAKRAFTGLAGSPLAQVAEPIVFVRAITGPKPRSGVAKSGKERVRELRARRQEPEKRQVIAEILRLHRRYLLPTPGKTKPGRHTAEDVRADNRRRVLRLSEDLMQETVLNLRKYLATLKQSPDSRGRLHNERSGERGQFNGMSEMERLDAQVQLARDENMGRRVEPKGYGPASYDKDPRIHDPVFTLEKPDSEVRIEVQIHLVLNEMADASADGPPKCLWCAETFETRTAAENHLHAEYDKARSTLLRMQDFKEFIEETEDSHVAVLLKDARKSLQLNEHYVGLRDRVKAQRRKERETKRKAKENEYVPSETNRDLRVW